MDLEDYRLVELESAEQAREIPGRRVHPMRNGLAQVWMMDPDGSNQRQLTFEGGNAHPAWSPDGTTIAFDSTRTGQAELWLMDADGSNQRQLTFSEPEEPGPFERLRHIELLMHSLYSPAVLGPTNVFPTWSPDGDRIAFCRIAKENYAIWVIDADGSNPRRITIPAGDRLVQANCPFCSPTSEQIAFWSGTNIGPGSIWVANSDGSDARRISNEPEGATCDEPAWSPDGRRVLYTTSRQDEMDGIKSAVWICDPDGSNQRPFIEGARPGFNRISWRQPSPERP